MLKGFLAGGGSAKDVWLHSDKDIEEANKKKKKSLRIAEIAWMPVSVCLTRGGRKQ